MWEMGPATLLERGTRILRVILINNHGRDACATFLHGSLQECLE